MSGITDRAMQARPRATDVYLRQPMPRGGGVLYGRITPAGERLWYLRYQSSTGREWFPIGPFDPKGTSGLTVAQAFIRAGELSQLYRSGVKDLRHHFAQLERDRLKDEIDARADAELKDLRRITLNRLFQDWCCIELTPRILANGKRRGRKDGGKWIRERFEKHIFPLLGNIPAADIRKSDLMSVLDAVVRNGKLRMANMLLAGLIQLFNFALDREIVAANPLARVRKERLGGPDTERQRILSDDEIEALHKAIPASGLNPRIATLPFLILATGVRIGELAGATWHDERRTKDEKVLLQRAADKKGVKLGFVNIEAKTWYLPDTKNQRDHTIHLSDFAIEQFRRLKSLQELATTKGKPSPWVYPSQNMNAGPVAGKALGKQLADRQRPPGRRISRRSKSTECLVLTGGRWTAHDLRRTAATLLARQGYSSELIDECLNHIANQSKVQRIYIRTRRESEQIRGFDDLGRELERIVSPKKPENVLPFQRSA